MWFGLLVAWPQRAFDGVASQPMQLCGNVIGFRLMVLAGNWDLRHRISDTVSGQGVYLAVQYPGELGII